MQKFSSISACVGANIWQYIMYHSDFWLNLHGIWEGWPFREVEGVFKWYYLVQWGFWIQQMLVVNVEEKRKDYAQMFTHHIFTTALLFLSYGYYHMRVGIVILCIMDFVDIILPVGPLQILLWYPKLTLPDCQTTQIHGLHDRL
jgi:acyl-CoA-dependent ceramide synthase